MNTQELQTILANKGFPVGTVDGVYGPKTRAALIRFQKAYYDLLPTDGTIDYEVTQALRRFDKTGNLSPNFTWAELRSKGDGTCYVRRELLYALEALRDYKGQPLPVISGFRDWAYHVEVYRRLGKRVVRGSKHLIGGAADFSRSYNLTLPEAKALKLFSGIGYLRRSLRVTHVDVRHAIEKTTWTVEKPSTWPYAE